MTLYWGDKNPYHEAALKFEHNRAVIIGIDTYSGGIPPLDTCVADAEQLAELLKTEHGYDNVRCFLNEDASLEGLRKLLEDLQQQVGEEDRLLVYYAGHGTLIPPEDSEQSGGYLIPHDAKLDGLDRFLKMKDLRDALDQLSCRHLLLVLDCCNAGSFKAETKNVPVALPTIYRQRYERYAGERVRQVLTSTAATELGLNKVTIGDVELELGIRTQYLNHSPFAAALFEALSGHGDADDDGLMPLPELYAALVKRIPDLADGHVQTPMIWSEEGHGGYGQFFFQTPGHPLKLLDDAPHFNPWIGSAAYSEEDASLYFGRDAPCQELVTSVNSHAVTVLSGSSGSGKTSLVQAGLIPSLKGQGKPGTEQGDSGAEKREGSENGAQPEVYEWHIQVLDSQSPVDSLAEWLRLETPPANVEVVREALKNWRSKNPNVYLLLVMDEPSCIRGRQAASDPDGTGEEQPALSLGDFLSVVDEWQHPWLHFLIVTGVGSWGRPDQAALPGANIVEMTRPGKDELQAIVNQPAARGVVFFESKEFSDDLIDDTLNQPGGLGLLSEYLCELYKAYRSYREKVEKDDNDDRDDDRVLRQQFVSEKKKEKELWVNPGTSPLHTFVVQKVETLFSNHSSDEGMAREALKDTQRRIWLRMADRELDSLKSRSVLRSMLIYPDDDENKRIESILATLCERRLVVIEKARNAHSNDALIQPAHAAIITSWKRISAWLTTADREFPITIQRDLEEDAFKWQQYQSSNVEENGETPEADAVGLWDTDPRLDLLQYEVLANQQLQGGSSAASPDAGLESNTWVRTAKSYVAPSLEIRKKPSWFSRAEGMFVAASVKKRRNSRLARIGTAAAFVIVLLVAAAGLYLANEDLRARTFVLESLLQSQEKDLVRASQLALEALERDPGNEDAENILYRDIPANLGKAVLSSRLLGEQEDVLSVSWNPKNNSNMVASASCRDCKEGEIRLWDAQRNIELELPINNYKDRYRNVAWNRDGDVLAAATFDGAIRFWSWDEQDKQAEILDSLSGHNGRVQGLAWNPEPNQENTLATSSADGSIKIWDANKGEQISTCSQEGPSVSSVAWSPDGQFLASTSDDRTLKIWSWDGEDCKELDTKEDHWDTVQIVAWSPDGRYLASGSDDKTIKLWFWNSQEKEGELDGELNLVHTLEGHANTIWDIAWRPDGQGLATASADGTIKLWGWDEQERKGELIQTLHDHTHEVKGVSWSPDGGSLVSGSKDGTIKVWDVEWDNSVQVLWKNRGPVLSIAWSPNGRFLASGSDDTSVRVWDWDGKKAEPIKTLTGHRDKVLSVAWNPNYNVLASTSCGHHVRVNERCTDGEVIFWDTENWEQLTKLSGHSDYVNSLAWSQDGSILASGSDDNTVKIWKWDAQEGIVLYTLNDHNDKVQSVAWSPDGSMLATGSDDSTVKIWKWDGRIDDEPMRTLTVHGDKVVSLAWHPTHEKFASASCGKDEDDGACESEIIIWDTKNWQPVKKLSGYGEYINSVAWHATDNLFASASCDKEEDSDACKSAIIIWDTKKWRPLIKLSVLGDDVNGLAWSPDGLILASGSDDRRIRLWPDWVTHDPCSWGYTVLTDEQWEVLDGLQINKPACRKQN